jgi:hypothetical protein
MFVGHYSAAFAGKAWELRIPLWVLFVATQLVDFLWSIFVLAGIEKVRIVPGLMEASALDLYYMPFTHSLGGALLWSVAGGVVLNFAVRARSLATAVIIGLAVFSHWIEDLIVHRPDLPLLGDGSPKLGLGLWNYFWPELALELILLAVTIHWWLRMERAAEAISERKIIGAWTLFGLLVIFQCIDKFGPLPASPEMAAVSAFAAYSVLAVAAAWVDRTPRVSVPS